MSEPQRERILLSKTPSAGRSMVCRHYSRPLLRAARQLSFLGFGLPATVPSWGGMLSREGRQYMEIAPRLRGAAGRYGGGRRRNRTPRRG